VGDRDLDGLVAPDAALDEELVIDRATVVLVETVFVRVIEPLQGEVFRTPRVRTIQKRAVMSQMRRRHEGIIGAGEGEP
jgi:hypothetical protein